MKLRKGVLVEMVFELFDAGNVAALPFPSGGRVGGGRGNSGIATTTTTGWSGGTRVAVCRPPRRLKHFEVFPLFCEGKFLPFPCLFFLRMKFPKKNERYISENGRLSAYDCGSANKKKTELSQ